MCSAKLLENRFQALLTQQTVVNDLPDYSPAGYPHQKAIHISGEAYQGKATDVFAYLGFPENADEENPVPAVVLIHGGGGYAFPEWIKKWNDKGYAAIAFCHTGHRPVCSDITDFDKAESWTRGSFPDSPWAAGPDNDAMANSDKDFSEQWIYHAICLAIMAHNILRQEKRIDKTKIGICGISWGSVVSSIAMSHDLRFAFAVPIYGSGYLSYGIGWVQRLFKEEPARSLWDCSERLEKVTIPVLWLCWANDPAFSIQPNSESFKKTINGEMSIQQNISHGHPEAWNLPEIYRFADWAIGKGEALVKCLTQLEAIKDGKIEFEIAIPPDAQEIKARLLYICETMTYSKNGVIDWDGCDTIDQTWQSREGLVKNGTVVVEIPKEANSYYVELTAVCENKKYVSSTQLFNA